MIRDFSSRVGNLNLETTKHTLASSVEAETRMTPRRHFKCRLPSLRPRCLTEGFSTDTFFVSTRSARGNTCMQVFLGIRSVYTLATPLKSKAYAHTALQDYIRTVGAPLFLKSDSTKEENLGEWVTICCTLVFQNVHLNHTAPK